MWSNLLTLGATVAGLFLALGVFFLLQSYVRWKSGCGSDRDLLDYMAHGCGGCKGPGSCGRSKELSRDREGAVGKEHHHELV